MEPPFLGPDRDEKALLCWCLVQGFQTAGPGGPSSFSPQRLPEWIAECKSKGAPTVQRPSSQLLPWAGLGYGTSSVGKGAKGTRPRPAATQKWPGPQGTACSSVGDRGSDWVGVALPLAAPGGSEVRTAGLHPGLLLLYQVWALTSACERLPWASP